MDFNSPTIKDQLQQASYGTGYISFLNTNSISFIQRVENKDYFTVYGMGRQLFKEHLCLKLGDIWPLLKPEDSFILVDNKGKIQFLINVKNVIAVIGTTIYFNDSCSLTPNNCSDDQVKELAKSIKTRRDFK
jgi:hypothetical protein